MGGSSDYPPSHHTTVGSGAAVGRHCEVLATTKDSRDHAAAAAAASAAAADKDGPEHEDGLVAREDDAAAHALAAQKDAFADALDALAQNGAVDDLDLAEVPCRQIGPSCCQRSRLAADLVAVADRHRNTCRQNASDSEADGKGRTAVGNRTRLVKRACASAADRVGCWAGGRCEGCCWDCW